VLNEEVWIRKAQAGDEQAFRRLVDRHAPVVWTVINRMTMDSALAQDLFQETVIRFWKGLPRFEGSSKLSTWLYRIAYRVCLDGLNEGGKVQSGSVSLEGQQEDVGFEPDDESGSGERIENDVAARDAVSKGLERLSPEWRAMIVMYYWRGMTIEEIADVTERPVNTVKVYLHRARGTLRELLQTGGYPSGG
jgi:RNA polymerase sigma-70 factor (ECF subfamily)